MILWMVHIRRMRGCVRLQLWYCVQLQKSRIREFWNLNLDRISECAIIYSIKYYVGLTDEIFDIFYEQIKAMEGTAL